MIFTPRVYFGALAGLMACSLAAFLALNHMRLARRERQAMAGPWSPTRSPSGSVTDSFHSSDAPAHHADWQPLLPGAPPTLWDANTPVPVNDGPLPIPLPHAQTPSSPKHSPGGSGERAALQATQTVNDPLHHDCNDGGSGHGSSVADVAVGSGNTAGSLAVPGGGWVRRNRALLVQLLWLAVLRNGNIGIMTYACMPYGAPVYHLAVTLGMALAPVGALVCMLHRMRATQRRLLWLAPAWTLPSLYLAALALASPTPPLAGTRVGSVLVVLAAAIASALLSYAQVGRGHTSVGGHSIPVSLCASAHPPPIHTRIPALLRADNDHVHPQR